MADGTIIHEGWAAAARLGVLGLDLEQMLEVVRRGELARAEATAYDPITAAGIDAYRFRVRALREICCPMGWKAERSNGLELVVSPNGNPMILTRAGDGGVGIRDADPQPKSDIGDGAAAALNGTLWLFESRWLRSGVLQRPEVELWMLLVYASRKVVRAELSLGVETKDGRVSQWFERIILPELDPDDLNGKRQNLDDQNDGALDVPVIRKK